MIGAMWQRRRVVQGYANWCREDEAPNRHSWAADRMARLVAAKPEQATRVILEVARLLRENERHALHSLGADAMEAVLGDHFERTWPRISAEALSLPQVATALEDVELMPDEDAAEAVGTLLAKLGRKPVWRDEGRPTVDE